MTSQDLGRHRHEHETAALPPLPRDPNQEPEGQVDLAAGLARGVKLLHDPMRNKGTAFSAVERDALGLRGLLPPRVFSQNAQVLRVLENLRNKPTDLERYAFLVDLQDRNETLFYRVIMEDIEAMMPLIYTPTVGRACQEFGLMFRRPRGLYITLEDRGRVRQILGNWPHREARVIVVTDGERILGLGDLGADGMGIPIGKLSLYTACAGIHPRHCLPICLDVGTDNEDLLADHMYIGLERRRERGDAYDELIEEFVAAVAEKFPDVLLQFEDFGNHNAFRLLKKYRDRLCCFDDDVQGTGAVAVAGLLSSLRITGRDLLDQKYLFVGAGQACLGTGELLVSALVSAGLDEREAHERCWFMDSRGLVVAARDDINRQKRAFAHEHPPVTDVLGAVEALAPTALIGACGKPSVFGEDVVRAMARLNERPVIFALSNPTSKAECTAEQAYEWSDGEAVFASGSPFPAVTLRGRTFVPGQGNNAYIFPGVGLGVFVTRATRVSDEMFLEAARVLASLVSDEDLELGRIYPRLQRIREVSAHIAVTVAEVAWRDGLAAAPRPDDVMAEIRAHMFQPTYPIYKR